MTTAAPSTLALPPPPRLRGSPSFLEASPSREAARSGRPADSASAEPLVSPVTQFLHLLTRAHRVKHLRRMRKGPPTASPERALPGGAPGTGVDAARSASSGRALHRPWSVRAARGGRARPRASAGPRGRHPLGARPPGLLKGPGGGWRGCGETAGAPAHDPPPDAIRGALAACPAGETSLALASLLPGRCREGAGPISGREGAGAGRPVTHSQGAAAKRPATPTGHWPKMGLAPPQSPRQLAAEGGACPAEGLKGAWARAAQLERLGGARPGVRARRSFRARAGDLPGGRPGSSLCPAP